MPESNGHKPYISSVAMLEWGRRQVEQMACLRTLIHTLRSPQPRWHEKIEAVGFWNLQVFAWFRLGEYVTAWFGKHHDAIFNAIPRGERGVRVNILAPRGSARNNSDRTHIFAPLPLL